MFDRKKIAALAASILICAASAASPVCVFADDNNEIHAADAEADDSSLVQSGDFTYSLTHDGNACIEDCISTEENLVIPDTLDGKAVTELGPYAFGSDHENNPYTSITLPASIVYISDRNPFMYCTKLTEVKVADGCADFCAEDGILYTKSKDKLVHYPCCKSGDSFSIPEGITSLGTASIYNTKLKEIKFPSTLEEIGVFAVGDTAELTNADLLGTKVHTIDTYAFSGCTKLEKVILPSTLEIIAGGAFARCTALENITLPDELTSIGQYAFMDTDLSVIIIPDSVESIGYCAFGYYTSPTGNVAKNDGFILVGGPTSAAKIYATDSDTDYEYQNNFVFMTPDQYAEQQDLLDLEKIKSGDYEYAVTAAGAVLTMCSSSDDKIEVPESLDGNTIVKIYPACFSNCQASEIILPNTVTELREMSFYNCQNLKSITLPESVKTIGNNAFDGCQSLESVEFLGAETIGNQVFNNCEALKFFTAAGCLNSWDDDEPFIFCTALREINIKSGEGTYSSADGILYNKGKTTLLAYPASKPDTSFKAPLSVEEIGQSAFAKANNLKSVDLPNVKVINSYAFEDCQALSSVKLSKELTKIGSDAFYSCPSLKSLRVYDKLTTIGTCAFGFCENDEATEETDAHDKVVDGFKLYAPKDSTAYKFAKDSGMEVITGTVEFFGKNMDIRFLGAIGGIIAAAILAVIGIITGKSLKKKKAAKELAERKAKSAELRKQQHSADTSDKKEGSANED